MATSPSRDAVAAGLLIDAVRRLASETTLDGITSIVKSTARQLARADGATFVLRNGEQCHYVDEEAISPLWKGHKFPLAACISGWSMLYRQQVIIPDIYADERIPHDAYRPTFVQSLAMTPIRTLHPWGAIGVYWASPHTPTADEAGWLQALADSTAVAMENVRVAKELGAAPRSDAGFGRSELLPMCAWTKRFSIDGEWVGIEVFLRRRFGIEVTHGISEEAIATMFD